jgi:adenine-specific DNA-methyltransferase
MDEIFGRNNFINHVSMTTNDPSGFKATSAKIFSTANHLLIYSASQNSELNKMWVSSEYDSNYDKVLFNKLEHYKEWEFKSIKEVVLNKLKYSSLKEFQAHFGKYSKEILNLYIKDFAYENPDIVFRTAAISGGAKAKRIATINLSKNKRNVVFTHPDDDLKYFYILNGEQIIFYSKRFVFINNLKQPSRALTNMWTDIRYTGIAKEGNVNFKNAKKPEKLIERVLTLGSNEGDLVLDSFLGSGTTAAVAHKMNRKYIGIELGEHCDTHCLPRLKQVVDGTDQGGISKTVNWQGGGGLRYYNLAPSLLKKDHRDNYIINPEYNAEMLAAAMAKHEGFTYSPCSKHYWKQGFSTETDYIFVTTQSVTVKLLDQVYSEMGENESLLVCCKAYSSACKDKYPNITIKKIPKMIQDRCEFGKEDYSLHIVDSPLDELRIESEPLDEVTEAKSNKEKAHKDLSQLSLFK